MFTCLFLILFLILVEKSLVGVSNAPSDVDVWNNIFNERSDEEWRSLWHTERYRRCYRELESHMKWVCSKDIYKVNKRRNGRLNANKEGEKTTSPFISMQRAHNMFSEKPFLRRKRGIIDECCHGPDGCSWEEYAEYCTHNNRVRV
ncbi:putative insulin-like peptide 7 [Dinothrombium tinctorium]|uniref:Putative insulin-like peptide 7 n=1 Tax=Dinothrombium tinctorium TaxID=1965070 RepID=A0A443RJ59_9ACAR|nr:putative insulin-like peptide 7 [Dinothrombium tinctorium]